MAPHYPLNPGRLSGCFPGSAWSGLCVLPRGTRHVYTPHLVELLVPGILIDFSDSSRMYFPALILFLPPPFPSTS